ncbi:lysophosphatidylserine lipase ABHD12 [Salmo salar]|uniref:Abhydrolase domain-containing protein 12 n=1 Tax=Salmo salar TaxID=8030 RepID=B5X4N4_SALSA|nr:lysophosphatidylserine lipase ABHD12 [Salmo salar]ACI34265.1 Abhydrolase domain-containing protein 12 [Salmo salar]|eukprot:NP_001133986.1 Abhydrolase domain-containing protein 12 [Salmo salar]
MQRTGGSVSKHLRMRKRTGDHDSEEQKTARKKTWASSSAQPRPCPRLLWWFKRGLLAVCVIYVSVPFMMAPFPDIIKHLVYSHRVRVPFFIDHSQPADLSLNHTMNMYLTSEHGISLGVWHTVPESQWKEAQGKDLEWYQDSLGAGNPIFIYLHGNGGTRAASHRVGVIHLLSAMDYHVLALDYRGFGDSTGEPTEVGLTTDTLYLYQWVKARSGSSLVVLWGHSLGTGVATNTAVKLMEHGIVVDGVIIEGAFTNIRQKGAHDLFGWFYWKFPGFEYFFLDTRAENNIIFPNDENLKRMRSPLLILHAEDDHIVPIHMAQQLYEIAQSAQNSENRVKMVPFARSLGYLHNGLYKDPHLPNIIREFVHSLPP